MDRQKLRELDLTGVAVSATLSADGRLGPVDGLARKIAVRGLHTTVVSDQQSDLDSFGLAVDPTQPLWRTDPTRDFRLVCAASLDQMVERLAINMDRWRHIDCDVDPVQDFVPRPGLDLLIDTFAASHGGHYLVIPGGMGRGKSTYIAERIQQARLNRDDPPVFHIIRGRESATAQPLNIAACLFDRLRRKYCDFKVPIEWGDSKDRANAPILLEKLLEELSRSLFVPRGRPEVIYLEAADQSNLPPNRVLLPGALQRELPAGVVVVITTRPNAAWYDQGPRIVVELFDKHTDDRQDIALYIRKRNARLTPRLSEQFIDQIVSQPTSPVFFTVRKVLDELERDEVGDDSPVARAREDVAPWLVAPEEKVREEYDRLERLCGATRISRDRVHEILGTLMLLKTPLSQGQLRDLGLWGKDVSLVLSHAASFFRHRLDQRSADPPFEWDHAGYEREIVRRLGESASARRQILERIANGCRKAWKDQGNCARAYARSHVTSHMVDASKWKALFDLLTDWRYLEVRAAVGQVFELVSDLDRALAAMHQAVSQGDAVPEVNLPLLRLVAAAVRTQVHAVARRDQPRDRANLLFQCCWNAGYWHDSDETKAHYDTAGLRGPFSWDQPVANRISAWVERWRREKIAEQGGFIWLRAHRPLPDGLLGPKVFRGHTGAVYSVAFSPDGACIASGSEDGTIRVWDAATCQPVLPPLIGHTDSVRSVAFSPNGTRIASGSDDRTVRIWNATTGQLMLPPLTHHTAKVSSISFSHDGMWIASGSYDSTILVCEVETGLLAMRPLTDHTSHVTCVSFSPDRTRIAAASSGSIRVWTLATAQPFPLLPYTWDAISVSFSPNSSRIAIGSMWKGTRIRDSATGQELLSSLHMGAASSVSFSPDGTRIVSGCRDSAIHVSDAETGEPILPPLAGHTSFVNSVSFSPDGTRIVSGSDDKTVRVWDVTTGQPILPTLMGHTDIVRNISFSRDGAQIICASEGWAFRVWDTMTGLLLETREGVVSRELLDTQAASVVLRARRVALETVIETRAGQEVAWWPVSLAHLSNRGRIWSGISTGHIQILSLEKV